MPITVIGSQDLDVESRRIVQWRACKGAGRRWRGQACPCACVLSPPSPLFCYTCGAADNSPPPNIEPTITSPCRQFIPVRAISRTQATFHTIPRAFSAACTRDVLLINENVLSSSAHLQFHTVPSHFRLVPIEQTRGHAESFNVAAAAALSIMSSSVSLLVFVWLVQFLTGERVAFLPGTLITFDHLCSPQLFNCFSLLRLIPSHPRLAISFPLPFIKRCPILGNQRFSVPTVQPKHIWLRRVDRCVTASAKTRAASANSCALPLQPRSTSLVSLNSRVQWSATAQLPCASHIATRTHIAHTTPVVRPSCSRLYYRQSREVPPIRGRRRTHKIISSTWLSNQTGRSTAQSLSRLITKEHAVEDLYQSGASGTCVAGIASRCLMFPACCYNTYIGPNPAGQLRLGSSDPATRPAATTIVRFNEPYLNSGTPRRGRRCVAKCGRSSVDTIVPALGVPTVLKTCYPLSTIEITASVTIDVIALHFSLFLPPCYEPCPNPASRCRSVKDYTEKKKIRGHSFCVCVPALRLAARSSGNGVTHRRVVSCSPVRGPTSGVLAWRQYSMDMDCLTGPVTSSSLPRQTNMFPGPILNIQCWSRPHKHLRSRIAPQEYLRMPNAGLQQLEMAIVKAREWELCRHSHVTIVEDCEGWKPKRERGTETDQPPYYDVTQPPCCTQVTLTQNLDPIQTLAWPPSWILDFPLCQSGQAAAILALGDFDLDTDMVRTHDPSIRSPTVRPLNHHAHTIAMYEATIQLRPANNITPFYLFYQPTPLIPTNHTTHYTEAYLNHSSTQTIQCKHTAHTSDTINFFSYHPPCRQPPVKIH
ncbi:hypothetical protein PR048_001213 [Dryococelus australis]|uniref:Uncharacterized protein n=1 Tax=Dryococelus australis TaxID=614101 RepID=A0ABQ9IGR2_9NEOP|nr:hypothetical protein PR048_001213 [Dryococelus australis]